jgi:hypothetical protein
MKPQVAWAWAAGILGWIALWGLRGGPLGLEVVLHWPVLLVLIMGYVLNLRGGLAAAGAASLFVAVLGGMGVIPSWTLVGWQILIFGIVGLYPFKFMQIREQRHHHYRTLIEYKRGEMESLKARLADLDHQCRELEQRVRQAGGAA